MIKVKQGKVHSFNGFSINRESFPEECLIEQWLSLALSMIRAFPSHNQILHETFSYALV